MKLPQDRLEGDSTTCILVREICWESYDTLRVGFSVLTPSVLWSSPLESSEKDPTPVGNWIKDQFGTRSAITAVFMTHAVLNESSILNHYLGRSSEHGSKDTAEHVPVTLKHFKLLARLGKAPVCNPELSSVNQAPNVSFVPSPGCCLQRSKAEPSSSLVRRIT